MPLSIWEGLDALDAVERKVRSGSWVQPEYSCAQSVELLPEVTPQPTVTVISKTVRCVKADQPTWADIEAFSKPRPKTDYDSLSAMLKGLKF